MKKRKINLYNAVLFLILVALIFVIGAIAPNFLKPKYFLKVACKNIVELGLLALPMTYLVIAGGIDFSVGSTMLLSALLGGMAAASWGPGWGIPVAVVSGTAAGLLNGALAVSARIPAMVATLSTYFLYTGIARVVTNGDGVYSYPAAEFLGSTLFGIVPLQIILYLGIMLIFHYVLKCTTLGRKMYAMGLNENSTRFSGIDVDRIRIGLYALVGFIGSIAGMIYLGRFSTIKYNADSSINLNVITIAVLGGTSIAGGKGNILGVFLGTMIIAMLNSGLTVLNIPIAMQMIVRGLVFLIALAVGTSIENRERKKIAKN